MTDNIKLPERPEPDGYLTIKIIERDVEVNAYRDSTMEDYARAAVLADRQQRGGDVTDDMRSAVRFAPSSAYWSERLREFFGPDAREGIEALEKQLREARAALTAAQEAPAHPNPPPVCQGTNCGATDGENHSPECILEAAEAQGWSDSPEAEAARRAIQREGQQ